MQLIGFQFLQAQNIAINSNGSLPASSAILDVQSTNKGILIPQVSLVSATDSITIPSPAKSLLIYNTDTVSTQGLQGEGYYYNAGNSSQPSWVKLVMSPASGTLQSQSDSTGTVKLERPPICEISMAGNTTVTPAPTINTWVKVLGSTTFNTYSYKFSNGATDNRMTYTGNSPKIFQIVGNFSVESDVNGCNLKAILYKNGVPMPTSTSQITLTGGKNDIFSVPIQVVTVLYPNDYLELWIEDTNTPANFTVTELSLMALGLSMGMD